jgi:hypothetical protein
LNPPVHIMINSNEKKFLIKQLNYNLCNITDN